MGIEERIIDELCTCGHLKSAHGDTIVKGHGSCKLCDCSKFTFIDFVLVDSAENNARYEPTPV